MLTGALRPTAAQLCRVLKTFHTGNYLRELFKEHHLKLSSLARVLGVRPQTVHGYLQQENLSDEILVRLGNASKLNVLGMVRIAKGTGPAKYGVDEEVSILAEPTMGWTRPSDKAEGLRITIQLDDYEQPVQLQIVRYLQQLPRRKH